MRRSPEYQGPQASARGERERPDRRRRHLPVPHAGATVASGTTIYLYTDTYSGSHTEVPDVSGKSADFARQMLTAAGLNCQVAGDSAGTVQSQSEAAGSSVQKGTVVTITCG